MCGLNREANAGRGVVLEWKEVIGLSPATAIEVWVSSWRAPPVVEEGEVERRLLLLLLRQLGKGNPIVPQEFHHRRPLDSCKVSLEAAHPPFPALQWEEVLDADSQASDV